MTVASPIAPASAAVPSVTGLFDDAADAAIADVLRAFPAAPVRVVAAMVRVYRPYTVTSRQTAHACKSRLREALAF